MWIFCHLKTAIRSMLLPNFCCLLIVFLKHIFCMFFFCISSLFLLSFLFFVFNFLRCHINSIISSSIVNLQLPWKVITTIKNTKRKYVYLCVCVLLTNLSVFHSLLLSFFLSFVLSFSLFFLLKPNVSTLASSDDFRGPVQSLSC